MNRRTPLSVHPRLHPTDAERKAGRARRKKKSASKRARQKKRRQDKTLNAATPGVPQAGKLAEMMARRERLRESRKVTHIQTRDLGLKE